MYVIQTVSADFSECSSGLMDGQARSLIPMHDPALMKDLQLPLPSLHAPVCFYSQLHCLSICKLASKY